MRASKAFIILGLCGSLFIFTACQPPAANSNTASLNTNINLSNSANTNSNPSSAVDARESDQYQATVKDVRAEVKDSAPNLYVIYDFVGNGGRTE